MSAALDNCDTQAHAAIAEAMQQSNTLEEAVAKALEGFEPGLSGARERWYQREVAQRVHSLWVALVGGSGSFWAYDIEASPAAKFAHTIFSLVEGREFDMRKTVRLMAAVKRG